MRQQASERGEIPETAAGLFLTTACCSFGCFQHVPKPLQASFSYTVSHTLPNGILDSSHKKYTSHRADTMVHERVSRFLQRPASLFLTATCTKAQLRLQACRCTCFAGCQEGTQETTSSQALSMHIHPMASGDRNTVICQYKDIQLDVVVVRTTYLGTGDCILTSVALIYKPNLI